MSTDVRTEGEVGFPEVGFRLAPSTALRRETFGAIAYSYETRRLRLIWSRLAAEIVFRVNGGTDRAQLVTWLADTSQVDGEAAGRRIDQALDALVVAGVLVAGPEPL